MSRLEQQVGQARWRLTTNVLMQRIALGVLIATGVWTLVLLTERAFALGIPVVHGIWVAGLIAATIAAVGTYLARVKPLQAAVAIDQAAGLKERISTGLAVRRDSDPFAQAVVRDAERTAAGVHVRTHLPYRAPALWPWSAACIVAAVILGFFMPELNLLAGQDPDDPTIQRDLADAERQNINRDLQAQVNRIKQMAEDNPALADIAEDIEPLQMLEGEMVTPEDIRREAVKKLDSVADRLADKSEEVARDALRDTQRLLSRLQPQAGQNPAAELSKALASGDFKGAKKAIEDLQEQLEEAAKKGDEKAQQQLKQMQNQLRRLADQLSELDDATYLQKELEKKAGLSEEQAKKLAEQLAKMDPKQLEKELQRRLGDKMSQKQIKELAKKTQKKQQARKSCQSLGQCMSQAAQALQQCNSPGSNPGSAQAASAALADAMSQLSDLEMSEQMLSELDAQLSDLQNMRDGVCQGNYCRGNYGNRKIGPQGPNYGLGIGSRIGKERTAHGLDPTKAKTRARGGTIIGQMLVDGPQIKGQANAELREAVGAATRDAQDAIDRDQVPRQYQSAVQKYFEQLAGLLRGSDDDSSDDSDQPDEPDPPDKPDAQPNP